MKPNKELVCMGHQIILHETSGDYDLMEGISAPGVPGPPPHYHQGYHELFMVIEGEMEFLIGDKAITVKAGSSIDIPANTLHTFKNAGNENCRFMNVHSPKGFMSLFETFGIDAKEENAFEKSVAPQLLGNLAQQSASYDMHIVMG